MDNTELSDLFHNHYSNLDEEAILLLNEHTTDAGLNNVVVGRKEHCYGLALIDDQQEIKYQIFYVRDNTKLEGDLIQLTLNMKYRDELVLYFSNFLSHNYKNIDLVDTFNTYQNLTRDMLEKIGFLTIDSTKIEEFDNSNPTIIAKGVKGIIPIRIIQKGAFYKDFFGYKDLPMELEFGSYVYLMLDKRNNYIKIGKSIRPTFREKTLQGEQPEIELIAYWEAKPKVEKELHYKFKDKRKRGEWFKLDFIDLKLIKKMMSEIE